MPGCLLPQRVVTTLIGFFALVWAYTHRVSISHVITELVVPINRTDSNTEQEDVCPPEEADGGREVGTLINNLGIYEWSEQMQGYVLGSFYIGYLITHMPGGIVADKYGAKWVLAICMGVSTLCTIFCPLAIEYGEQWGLMCVRIMMGAAQGLLFPSLTTLLSAWVPTKERGKLGTLCYSGVTAGTVVSNLGSGLMLHAFHWSVTLYVFAIVTAIWFIIFIFLCSSEPSSHLCIKPKEMAYLDEEIPKKSGNKVPIPWKEIMLSKEMFAVIVSQIGHDWGYFVMISCLPKYMANVLQFSVRSNGIVTALPFIAMFLSTLLFGHVADWIIRSGKLTITVERKLFTIIGAFFPGLFMVLASYAGCNKTLVVTLFTISMFVMGPYYSGQKLTPLDMAPSYSGTIMAITNGLGSLAGMLSPPIVGLLTPNATMNEWRMVFWLGFAILVISAIVFAIWGTAEVQPYDPRFAEKKAG
ncbi:GH11095 [Drosophila grimshawi]|uniref:GH11095 n=1 Tax=Drosophila grimshawi TaxID=7222 RepID=B4JCU1_DROGR|nr:GH11095 [Drosophila grimshawi]